MAKKSKIARNEQRKVIVDRWAAKRLELKKALVDPNGTDESREAARLGLQKLPRNASPVRVRNRDAVDGRPRGHIADAAAPVAQCGQARQHLGALHPHRQWHDANAERLHADAGHTVLHGRRSRRQRRLGRQHELAAGRHRLYQRDDVVCDRRHPP